MSTMHCTSQVVLSNSTSQIRKENNEYSQKKLVLLWGLILVGYFLFVVQWYSISNFQGSGFGTTNANGWGATFFSSPPSAIVSGSLNWTITLGRAVGSILAGWLIAKIGHKYAVITVLSLMVLSFPFIIVSQNQSWNALSIAGGASLSPDGVATLGMSLFVIFRIFLAVGGTTLITYTNSIISRMDNKEKAKYMTINQFGFNGGAFVANIFFVIPGAIGLVNGNSIIWTAILSSFVILVFIILVLYVLYGTEMVNKSSKSQISPSNEQITLGKVIKEKNTLVLAGMFSIWLISVVFITSSTMRTFIEQSPANFKALAIANALNPNVKNINTSSWYWVWPTFICLFVAGFFLGIFWLANFGKTIFERRFFVRFMFAFGYLCMLISLLCGYFGGYDNTAALVFMLIFIFLSGFFLWSVQPILLTIPQQLINSNPRYMGFAAGLIWGIGYLGYTIGEILMSSLTSFVSPFGNFAGNFQIVGETIRNEGITTYNDAIKEFNNLLSTNFLSIKSVETPGIIASFIIYWIILCSIFPLTIVQPKSGYWNKNNEFIIFYEKWNPFKNFMQWNIKNKNYLIETYSR
ncbi:MFS transporter [Mycoplasmoides alvi]|uniref:MFS transporter n=1 Tax=Mycoplasmoides alvi TaxID=78580 RepID=UPI00051BDA0D|nr:MFS transporter [Mycoplasmoides alvi]